MINFDARICVYKTKRSRRRVLQGMSATKNLMKRVSYTAFPLCVVIVFYIRTYYEKLHKSNFDMSCLRWKR